MSRFKNQPEWMQKLIDNLVLKGLAIEFDEKNKFMHVPPTEIKIPIKDNLGRLAFADAKNLPILEKALASDFDLQEFQKVIDDLVRELSNSTTDSVNETESVLNSHFDSQKISKKVFVQSLATYHLIQLVIENDSWLDYILDYVDVNFWSFGMPQSGYDQYLESVIYLLRKSAISNGKVHQLIQSFEDLQKGQFNHAMRNLRTKEYLFDEWLESVPDLEHLQSVKEMSEIWKAIYCSFGSVEIGKANRIFNRETADQTIHDELLSNLDVITRSVIRNSNILSLSENNKLGEYKNIEQELEHAIHKLKLKKITHRCDMGLYSYEVMWLDWLENEKQFYSNLTNSRNKDLPTLTPKSKEILENLNQHGFNNFLTDHGYAPSKVAILMSEHSSMELVPFSIALLYELGYLKYFLDEFCRSKTERSHKLAKIFDMSERRIKGNINIISNSNSREDPTQYTSITYQETVRKQLEGLK